MMFNLNEITRPNIRKLEPYSCARDEFEGEATIFLDANENNFGPTIRLNLPVPLNRYPSSDCRELKMKLAKYREVNSNQVFVGVGSDEIIDLLVRIFCEPRVDNIIYLPPTFGMYQVSAETNDVEARQAPLTESFQIDRAKIFGQVDDKTKIIFLCSPNNPTGNLMNKEEMIKICKEFSGIVVVDEAYIEFAEQEASMIDQLDQLPNLVVLNTLSKAWGLAGVRIGIAYSSPEIIAELMKVKMPYNINVLSSYIAEKALQNNDEMKSKLNQVFEEREMMKEALQKLQIVSQVFPSDTNFLLVQFTDAKNVYQALLERGIVVRDQSSKVKNCLRITIGRREENDQLLSILNQIS